MFSTAACVRRSLVAVTVALGVCSLAPLVSARAENASLFRIFLLQGEPLVSYGEFARVGDRVVFSVPMGDAADSRALQIVSIPSSLVDWPRTEEYAQAVRAKHYAETRGEEDFALLASRVTMALNDINLAPDSARRLAMADEARRNLAAWPAANYGYRAAEVAQLVSMLDEMVAEMRSAAGRPFELSLVATTVAAPPDYVEVLAPPDLQATWESAFRAAVVSAEPYERMDLLRALSSRLAVAPRSPAVASLRSQVRSSLEAELKVEKAYQELLRSSLRDAQQRAARGDAHGLQQVIARALSADDRLGRKRTGEMSALLATLDLRLDEARRVRAAREAWAKRVEVFKAYRRATDEPRDRMNDLSGALRDIRDHKELGGRSVHRVEIHATMAIHQLRPVDVPAELQGAHGLLVTALQLARQAAVLRRDAVSSKNTKLAWDASSAAAGALMLAERAADELKRLIIE